jgi:hypothetical protein
LPPTIQRIAGIVTQPFLAAIIEAEHHVPATLLAVAINAAEERAAAVEPVHPRLVTPLLCSAGG